MVKVMVTTTRMMMSNGSGADGDGGNDSDDDALEQEKFPVAVPWCLLPANEVVDQLHNPRKALLFPKHLLRVVLQLCDATNLSCRYLQHG